MTNADAVFLIPVVPETSIQESVATATCGSDSSRDVTCQVSIDGTGDQWILHSLDQHGHRKTHGGDEFYVRYQEYVGHGEEEIVSCQAVAIISDHEDGSYTLDFVTTPMHSTLAQEEAARRSLEVYFEYSNGIGRIPPPDKQEWQNGGYSHRVFRESQLPTRPPIRAFVPPTSTVDLGSFNQVFAFGDSTMDQFVRQRPNKKGKYYFQPRIRVGEKVQLALNSETVNDLLKLLEDDFGTELRKAREKDTRVGLVLGSCLWDILDAGDTLQGSSYADHIQACRDYIGRIRDRYENVDILWKSPMAVHVHWVDLDRLMEHDQATATLFGVNRVKYMSASRSLCLYTIQKRVMQELGVPFLDLFEATYLSSDQLFPSDGRHYRPDLNRLMLRWFFPNADDSQKYFQNS